MKKVLLILLAILLLGGAAGAVYYFYFMPKDDPNALSKLKDLPEPEPIPEGPQAEDSEPDPTRYYVIAKKLNVYLAPSEKAVIGDVLYKGDHVDILERKHDWVRISEYWMMNNDENSPMEANWVNMNALSVVKPEITKEERITTIIEAIEMSDNYQQNKNAFIKATDTLLQKGICHWPDFEALNGWVKSFNYKDRDVYFIYCGGMRISDKIYLDASTGKIFTAASN